MSSVQSMEIDDLITSLPGNTVTIDGTTSLASETDILGRTRERGSSSTDEGDSPGPSTILPDDSEGPLMPHQPISAGLLLYSAPEAGGHDQPLLTQLHQLNKKFRLSCKQVVLLNNAVEYLQERYNRSVKDSHRTYRYFLRLRLATLEGIRNMYYEYACRKADDLDVLHERLLIEGVIEQELDLSDMDDE